MPAVAPPSRRTTCASPRRAQAFTGTSPADEPEVVPGGCAAAGAGELVVGPAPPLAVEPPHAASITTPAAASDNVRIIVCNLRNLIRGWGIGREACQNNKAWSRDDPAVGCSCYAAGARESQGSTVVSLPGYRRRHGLGETRGEPSATPRFCWQRVCDNEPWSGMKIANASPG